MAKEFLHKEGLTKLVENIKAWCKGAFLGKDATITNSSGTNKGVSVSIQGSVSGPSVSVSVTTSGVSANNSGIVSGSEVKDYVDKNAASTATFKAATSSSNAVNGLVPAPSSANATKFLRGDGTWSVPPLATNNTDGLMSATDKTTLDQSVAMVTPITGDDGSCVLEVERNDGTSLEFPVPKVGYAKEADNALNLDGVSNGKLTAQYINPKLLTASNSLNTIDDGFYCYQDGNNPANAVGDNAAVFQISGRNWDRFQFLFPGNADGIIRYRFSTYLSISSATWFGWRTIAFTDSDITGKSAGLKHSNGTIGAVVDAAGNVGIGTAAPAYKLEVNGTANATTLYENGTALTNKYATIDDITNGNITAAKATTADSANAIGGKGLNDLVQGGGTIKFIKVVTSLPANPSSDTLYLIKQ